MHVHVGEAFREVPAKRLARGFEPDEVHLLETAEDGAEDVLREGVEGQRLIVEAALVVEGRVHFAQECGQRREE